MEKKIMALSKAAIRAIAIRRKAKQTAANDNQTKARRPANPKSAYVNTTMSPAMLAACVEATGLQA